MEIDWDTLHLEYDPFKARIGNWIRKSSLLRKLFYYALGCMFLREKYVKRELRRIVASAKAVNDIWDAGSGYGQYSWFCIKLFPSATIIGTDVKEEQVHDCNSFCRKLKLDRCRFQIGDLEQASYRSQFDLILSVDVMEHIPDDVAVFRNFHRALRPGGLCIINTPSRKPDSIPKDSDQVDSVVAEHVREGYTPEEIRRKLSDAGLEVNQIMFAYGEHGAKAWKLLQGHPMRWLHANKWILPLLPIYYLIAYPIAAYWMRRDLKADNQWGGGLLVVAEKPRGD